MLSVVSLGLVTGYAREGPDGSLHGFQSAVGEIVAPVQDAADAAVEPVRDAWNWTTSLIDARDRAEALERQNRQLLKQAIGLRNSEDDNARLRAILRIRESVSGGYAPLTAQVTGKSVSDYYRRVRVNVGSADGVLVNSPVIAPSTGQDLEIPVLVGIVVQTSASTSDIALVTDRQTRVGAFVQRGSQVGILEAVDNGQLALRQVPREFRVRRNDVVLTAGYDDLNLPSPYPRGLAVGRVTSVGSQVSDTNQRVQVTPLVDVRELQDVVVLAPTSAEARRRASG